MTDDDEATTVVLFAISAFFTVFGLLLAPQIDAPWYVQFGAFGVALAIAVAAASQQWQSAGDGG